MKKLYFLLPLLLFIGCTKHDELERQITELLNTVQSLAVVPTNSDGSVTIGNGDADVYFEVLPENVGRSLESVALSAFSLKAVSVVQVKSDIGSKEMPIKAVKFEDGLLKVSTSGQDLGESFFNGQSSLMARFAVTAGQSSISSPYFGLKPQGDDAVFALRMAENLKKIVDRWLVREGNAYLLRFTDGTSVEFQQHSLAPILSLSHDGYWAISYDNGNNTTRLTNSHATFIQVDDLYDENLLMVRLVEGNDGHYAYQSYRPSAPDTILEEAETPVPIDAVNSVFSILEDMVHHTVVITLMDGQSFTFMKERVVPTGINVLTNKILLSSGVTVPVEFRVNPSHASFDFDTASPHCEISLDYVGEATKSSYVTTPANFELAGVEQVYDAAGTKKEGQYRAFITDLGTDDTYDDLVTLVLTVNDGLGRTVQLSSSAFETKYSGNLISEFSFLKADNACVLEDVTATIDGNNITVTTPFILDKSALVASFKTNGAKVFAQNREQVSGISVVDFTSPVEYTVLSADGEMNTYTVTVQISGLPVVYINTKDGVTINSKTDWFKKTYIKIIDEDGTLDYEDSSLQIRGRGNSTWTYPKKPYALKLKEKHGILGMPQHKRWVLLANWMDRTLLRNDAAFQIARQTGMSWTPRGKFVEVVLNGTHVGNYYLCEQIKIDANRVNITEMTETDISGDAVTGGYLMELDVNYDEVNKFHSAVRNLPYMFKEPDEEVLQPEQFNYMQNYIDEMESRMYAEDWLSTRDYAAYLDLETFADWWFVYELAKNADVGHPKSVYMYKDRSGPLKAGPVWDFDWGTFTPGARYSARVAVYYERLFRDPAFAAIVKTRWAAEKPQFDLIGYHIRAMAEKTKVSNEINIGLWPISSTVNGDESLSFEECINRMVSAYEEQLEWLDAKIEAL